VTLRIAPVEVEIAPGGHQDNRLQRLGSGPYCVLLKASV